MTELVTNSIKQGSGPVDVELTADSDNLVLIVSDASPEMPPRRCLGTGRVGGGRERRAC